MPVSLRYDTLATAARLRSRVPEEPRHQSWWQTVPGMLTAIAGIITAVTGLIVAVANFSHRAPTVTPPPPPEARLNIAGNWSDNWGNFSQVTQNGASFSFTIQGTSCQGIRYTSTGTGTIEGTAFRSSYRSSLPSSGNCSGTITGNGTHLESDCEDSLCGRFHSSANRQ